MEAYSLNELAALAANYVNTTNRHIFLTGKAGTGKTTFLRYIIDHTYKNAVVAAPTGIAAINAGGVTLHSLLQLPFGAFIPEYSLQNQPDYLQVNTPITLRKQRRFRKDKLKMIREMELLIIDEVSMLRADLLDCMDYILRSLRRRGNEPFGGLQILFIGDLMQLPPVVKDEEWAVLHRYYKSPYFFEAQALKQHTPPLCVELQKIYRQSDQDFIDILNRLRHNTQTAEDISQLNEHYRPQLKPKEEKGYIHLTTHNYKADKINEERLKQLKGKTLTFDATIDGDFPDKLYPNAYGLKLKTGAQVMFIKNDPTGEGQFFNGKIGTISRLKKDQVWVRFESDEEIEVDSYGWEHKRYDLNEETNEVIEVILGTFTQFPLKLAWAVTIHKSQGLTFEKAILDMADTFAPGQLYVALSRLTSLDGLLLSSPLPQNPPGIDHTLQAFVSGFPDADDLAAHLRADRRGFLWKFGQQAFDFTSLLKSLNEHASSFDKQENRSIKQQYLPWTQELIADTEPLLDTGATFIRQVGGILKEEGELSFLAERVQKAQSYFEPILLELIKRLRNQQEELGRKKSVKTYREELEGLTDAYIHQCRQMMKLSLLIQESAAGRIPSKDKLRDWEKELSNYFHPPKKEKIPTAVITFQMYQEGKSILKIAKERNLTQGTIESHLTEYVKNGEVDIRDFMEEERLDEILAVATKKGVTLNQAKAKLGADYSYGEIKLALAYASRG